MPATDPCQQLSDAIATIVDTNAAVITATGRSSGNIVRWKSRKASTDAAPRVHRGTGGHLRRPR
jgi:hypothetical protein